jgi:hypothetical protein
MSHSFIKKIAIILSIQFVISPIFFLQSKILFAQTSDRLNITNVKAKDEEKTNTLTSFLNRLSVRVYCGITGIFNNVCGIQGTTSVQGTTSTTNNTTNQTIVNRNDNRTNVTNTQDTQTSPSSGGDFVVERINELTTILRNEIRNNAIYSTGPQGPQGVAGPVGPRGAGGGGGRGRDGATGPAGPAGADAFLTIGAPGYILQSTGTTTEWVATSTLGITGGSGTFSTSSARLAISESILGVDYNSTTGDFSLTSGYTIPTTASSTDWNSAFSWGDHGAQGYMTSLDLNNLAPVVVGNGNATTTLGTNASIFGRSNTASGQYAMSSGYSNNASGDRSVASGYDNRALGFGATAVGYRNWAISDGSTSVGYNNYTDAKNASSFGNENQASGTSSIAVGNSNYAQADYSTVVGYDNWASASGASIFGSNINNTIASSTMIGPSNSAKVTILSTGELQANFINATSTTATSSFSGAVDVKSSLLANGSAGTTGYILQTTGTGVQWVATSTLGFGSGESFSTSTTRSVFSSSATGLTYNSGTGDFSLTSGYSIPLTASTTNWNSAFSWGDHATQGYLTSLNLNNLNSVVVGNGNSLSGFASTTSSIFGRGNIVSNTYASAFGNSNTASGYKTSAAGYDNTASASGSSAFGYVNTASGIHSSAFGDGNTASANNTSAFGFSNNVTVSGSTAVGYDNTVNAGNASAFGSSITNAISNSTNDRSI